ncbi:MAG: homoserine dehydrogenase [Thermovirgaceae bacterium]|nr:homoserine dehydrogenase [Thermovirgaceae bacterium]
MNMWKIGCVGFGNVGQGLARILVDKREALKERYGFEYSVTFIAAPVKGSLFNPNGIDLASALAVLDKTGSLKGHPDATEKDTLSLISGNYADIITEATYTDLKTGEPGVTHIRTALDRGIHVVSTNKGPVSIALPELMELAEKNGVSYFFEGVVMSGTPTMNLAREALAGCDITGAMGIVNGTTNYILTRMEEGMPYGEALKKAQELGYAEADPTGDVEGWDAAVKVQVLAKVLMGEPIRVEDVDRTGITGITSGDIEAAAKRGARIKLIAEVRRENGILVAKVAPKEIPLTHPLAGIMNATNAITLVTDHLGEVTIVGPGAGRVETGQALLADLLSVHRSHS